MSEWSEWTRSQLACVEANAQWRSPTSFDCAGVQARMQGRDVINFAANDYLGLASHPDVRAAARAAIDRWGAGASASRLVTGTRSLHAELEAELAHWQRMAKALVFSTGYAANVGVLTVFGARDTTIFSDELNHASIVDGCRLAKAHTVVFPHNDVARLAELMQQTSGRKLVITEAVFSMDGDQAPLNVLAALCARQGALLVIDEAHAVFGTAFQPIGDLDYLRVGTLSKTLAALGGWVAGSVAAIDLLVNRARTFIFTTALTPPDTAAALAALKIYRSEEGERLRHRLRANVDEIRPRHPSAILPLVFGDESAALAASSALLEQGVYVPAIRPPTVPQGTSRLRLTLSAAHTDAMIVQLKRALASLSGFERHLRLAQ
jgi:8-amino-7-oxononanoate synthase